MQKNSCLACRTALQDGESLPPLTMSTEYKEYLLPLRQERVRWDVLKTIVSFLNSYGGVIFLGIDQTKGTVTGQKMEKKDQDTFKLFMKQLLEKVHPKVDLKQRQEVAIQFVPVLRKKQFEGKYVTKIIVQQGDPSQVYYFGEKIKLESQTGKMDQIQVYYAYQRDNMGGMTQIKGVKLLQALHERGTKPNDEFIPTHEGCNPQPPHLEVQTTKIYFFNVTIMQYSILDSTLETYFRGVDYGVSYQEEKKCMLVEFDDQEEFKIVLSFMQENLDDLNRNSFRLHGMFLQMKGEKESYYLIENNPKIRKIQKEEKPNKKQQKYLIQHEQRPIFNTKQLKNDHQAEKKVIEKDHKPKPPPNNFPKKFSLTITHINPQKSKDLQYFLTNSICKKIQKHTTRYIHTIQVFMRSEQELKQYYNVIMKNQQTVAAFGRSGIVIGINCGYIRIFNYDKNRREEMAIMLQKMIGKDLREIGTFKQGNQFSYVLLMKDKSTACIWLDNILQTKCLSEFSDKSKQGRAGKIFVRLELE